MKIFFKKMIILFVCAVTISVAITNNLSAMCSKYNHKEAIAEEGWVLREYWRLKEEEREKQALSVLVARKKENIKRRVESEFVPLSILKNGLSLQEEKARLLKKYPYNYTKWSSKKELLQAYKNLVKVKAFLVSQVREDQDFLQHCNKNEIFFLAEQLKEQLKDDFIHLEEKEAIVNDGKKKALHEKISRKYID